MRHLIFCIALIITTSLWSQPNVAVEGAISIGNDLSENPQPGTIRFNGSDFQGWNGTKWISLSIGNVIEPSTDGGGNNYPSIQIGSQVWMAKNLNTPVLNDGTPILNEEDGSNWGNLAEPAYCYYQNGSELGDKYGALYNWFTVETGKLCPVGWRVPSK